MHHARDPEALTAGVEVHFRRVVPDDFDGHGDHRRRREDGRLELFASR
jgi:hypothetical protein